jgi:hypothetical protein
MASSENSIWRNSPRKFLGSPVTTGRFPGTSASWTGKEPRRQTSSSPHRSDRTALPSDSCSSFITSNWLCRFARHLARCLFQPPRKDRPVWHSLNMIPLRERTMRKIDRPSWVQLLRHQQTPRRFLPLSRPPTVLRYSVPDSRHNLRLRHLILVAQYHLRDSLQQGLKYPPEAVCCRVICCVTILQPHI